MAKLPAFKSIEEESEFWDTHDATDYVEETVEVDICFVDARPDLPITVRLPRAAMA
ncbi:MAG: BrnA antitoxin family protein [Chloroflexota bacterium]|nr:BrnA antitoxin family protein [Chloroflexota bacterium]